MCLIFGSFCEDCFFYFKTTCTWKTTVLSDILCACLYYVVLINVFIKITFSKLPKAFFLLFFFAECVVEHKQPTHFSWENEVESIWLMSQINFLLVHLVLFFIQLKIYLSVQQSADMAHQLCSYWDRWSYNDVNEHWSGFDSHWTLGYTVSCRCICLNYRSCI